MLRDILSKEIFSNDNPRNELVGLATSILENISVMREWFRIMDAILAYKPGININDIIYNDDTSEQQSNRVDDVQLSWVERFQLIMTEFDETNTVDFRVITKNFGAEHRQFIKELVSSNFSSNVKFINTPVSVIVAYFNCMDILTRLLANGVNPNDADVHLGTPLMVAATEATNLHIVQLLLKNNVVLDHTNQAGATAFVIAVVAGNQQIVLELLHAGVNINKRYNGVRTALSMAIDRGDPDEHADLEMVKFLIEQGADVDQLLSETTKQTALILAVRCGEYAIVKYLVEEAGADVTKRDVIGVNAAGYAELSGYPQIAQYLLDKQSRQHRMSAASVKTSAASHKTPAASVKTPAASNNTTVNVDNGITHTECQKELLPVLTSLLQAKVITDFMFLSFGEIQIKFNHNQPQEKQLYLNLLNNSSRQINEKFPIKKPVAEMLFRQINAVKWSYHNLTIEDLTAIKLRLQAELTEIEQQQQEQTAAKKAEASKKEKATLQEVDDQDYGYNHSEEPKFPRSPRLKSPRSVEPKNIANVVSTSNSKKELKHHNNNADKNGHSKTKQIQTNETVKLKDNQQSNQEKEDPRDVPKAASLAKIEENFVKLQLTKERGYIEQLQATDSIETTTTTSLSSTTTVYTGTCVTTNQLETCTLSKTQLEFCQNRLELMRELLNTAEQVTDVTLVKTASALFFHIIQLLSAVYYDMAKETQLNPNHELFRLFHGTELKECVQLFKNCRFFHGDKKKWQDAIFSFAQTLYDAEKPGTFAHLITHWSQKSGTYQLNTKWLQHDFFTFLKQCGERNSKKYGTLFYTKPIQQDVPYLLDLTNAYLDASHKSKGGLNQAAAKFYLIQLHYVFLGLGKRYWGDVTSPTPSINAEDEESLRIQSILKKFIENGVAKVLCDSRNQHFHELIENNVQPISGNIQSLRESVRQLGLEFKKLKDSQVKKTESNPLSKCNF